MVVVVVALKLRSLGFGFRAGREATRVNKLLLLPGRGGGLEYRGRWIARGCGKEEREKGQIQTGSDQWRSRFERSDKMRNFWVHVRSRE